MSTDTSMFEEMEASGSHIPQMVKELIANGWVTYKHHDNWIRKEWLDTPLADTNGLDLHAAHAEINKVRRAMRVLTDVLSEDKSEGSYYYSWQANIAMAFYDQFVSAKGPLSFNQVVEVTSGEIHKIANDAAKRFLDLLISDKYMIKHS